MIAQVVFSRARALVLWLLALLRRACCCFRRRRRLSESLPLTAIGVIPNDPQEAVQGGWDNWGKEEDEITRQIREYRTALAEARYKQTQPEEEPPEAALDFFQDMTPKVTKAPRITLKSSSDHPDFGKSPDLFAAQPMPIAGGDLGTWAEDEGWEAEEGDWEEEVREQRKQQREKRALELQMKRAEHRSGLGARLSNS